MSVSGEFQATKKLKLNAGVVYNKAEDSWNWKFENRPSLNWSTTKLDQDNDGDADAADLATIEASPAETNYDTTEQNNDIDSYSDLSYQQYQITIGGSYDFTEALFANASFTYDIFDAAESYVYGDEDGTSYYGYVGIGWRF